MEDLNKTQIVLLAIFITFVTSAATGVIVVTLMDQAPQGVTQTINRVVERTVETVVSPGKVEKTEIKQIVKEDDTIVSSIKKVRQSLVTIIREDNGGVASGGASSLGVSGIDASQQASISGTMQSVEGIDASLALVDKVAISAGGGTGTGFWVSNDGILVATLDILGGAGSNYFIILGDKTKLSIMFLKSDDARGIALFKLNDSEKDKVSVIPINGLSQDRVSLGQTVISLGTELGQDSVSIGYVSGLRNGNASTTAVIKTSLKPAYSWGGRPLIDINGFLIGMYGLNNEIIPYQAIRSLIDSLEAAPKATTTPDTKPQ